MDIKDFSKVKNEISDILKSLKSNDELEIRFGEFITKPAPDIEVFEVLI